MKGLVLLQRPHIVFFLVIVSTLLFLSSLMISSPIGTLLRGLAALLLGAVLIDGILTVRFQINIENQIGILDQGHQRPERSVRGKGPDRRYCSVGSVGIG